uniref:Uncharacterized protein n=1 Tax=Arundo donax TaxID=35708 RepID=A0A0A9ADH2_ARUDO
MRCMLSWRTTVLQWPQRGRRWLNGRPHLWRLRRPSQRASVLPSANSKRAPQCWKWTRRLQRVVRRGYRRGGVCRHPAASSARA